MSEPPRCRVLVVDDEPDLVTLYELALVREGYDVVCAASLAEARALLESAGFQVVLTDMRLPDGTGLELLVQLEAQGRPERTVVITAFGSAQNAVQALKAGAFDYLTKPVDLRQLRTVVASALGRLPVPGAAPVGATDSTGLARGPAAGTAGARALARLVGPSPALAQVRALVGKVARGMAPVLVCGESGTGKELVARAIHACSPRAQGPFVAVNCGAIPEALLEAEFFGFRKGAFTGAFEDRTGFFQAAQGGTLFLDELGELPLAMQSKLLRAVQERAVRAVGSVAETPVDVRLVSATHRDLAEEVQAGRFRQDLYFRLNVIRIHVPPLRERVEDIGPICGALLVHIAREAGVSDVPELSAACLEAVRRLRLPGNVRELENVLHRAVALSAGGVIEPEDLMIEATPAAPAILQGSAPPPASVAVAADELPGDLLAHLDRVERDILERALVACRYNRTAAGARLGLTLRQMRYRMARLGIEVDDVPASAD